MPEPGPWVICSAYLLHLVSMDIKGLHSQGSSLWHSIVSAIRNYIPQVTFLLWQTVIKMFYCLAKIWPLWTIGKITQFKLAVPFEYATVNKSKKKLYISLKWLICPKFLKAMWVNLCCVSNVLIILEIFFSNLPSAHSMWCSCQNETGGCDANNPSCRGEIETFCHSLMPRMFLLVLIHPFVRKKIPKICRSLTDKHQWESQKTLENHLSVCLPAELHLLRLNKQFKWGSWLNSKIKNQVISWGMIAAFQ